MKIVNVKDLLPHREPFLFIDEVVEIVPQVYSKATKRVGEEEFWVKGHFPDGPVYPGALLMETMAQGGGVLLNAGEGHSNGEYSAYLSKVDQLKFVRKVLPSDLIVVEGYFVERVGSFSKVKTKATVNGVRVAEAIITYVTSKKL